MTNSDYADPSSERPDDERVEPKLRYDAPHPQPPRPMFVRLDRQGPDAEEP